MMNYVKQEDRTGCGIACAAMIGKISYQDAMIEARSVI